MILKVNWIKMFENYTDNIKDIESIERKAG